MFREYNVRYYLPENIYVVTFNFMNIARVESWFKSKIANDCHFDSGIEETAEQIT